MIVLTAWASSWTLWRLPVLNDSMDTHPPWAPEGSQQRLGKKLAIASLTPAGLQQRAHLSLDAAQGPAYLGLFWSSNLTGTGTRTSSLTRRRSFQELVTFLEASLHSSSKTQFRVRVQNKNTGRPRRAGLLEGASSLQRYGTVCSGELLSNQMPNCCGDETKCRREQSPFL